MGSRRSTAVAMAVALLSAVSAAQAARAAQVVVAPGPSVRHVECSSGCQATFRFKVFNTGTPDYQPIEGYIDGFREFITGDVNDAINFSSIDQNTGRSCGDPADFFLGPAKTCYVKAIFAIVDGDPLDTNPAIDFGDWKAGVRIHWRLYKSPPSTPYQVTENYGMIRVTDSVPEPATWALMIGGFGLAGAVLRRRRTMVAAWASAN